jgi:hypothetical protein
MVSMRDAARRLTIFAVVASVFSYGVLLVGGKVVEANATHIIVPMVIRDTPEKGAHILSGTLLLPVSCDELSAHIIEVSTSSFVITLSTWQDPAVTCTQDKISKWFQTVAFAPQKGIVFAAKLDGQDIPMVIEHVAEGQ